MYVIAPFVGWILSGTIKFIINYIRFGSEAKKRIGNGGFPSTHTTIMSTSVSLIGWNEGFTSAIFGLGVAISYIVVIDAIGLRRVVGRHAESLNTLNGEWKHRVSMGHSKNEVLGGMALGFIIGSGLYWLSLNLQT